MLMLVWWPSESPDLLDTGNNVHMMPEYLLNIMERNGLHSDEEQCTAHSQRRTHHGWPHPKTAFVPPTVTSIRQKGSKALISPKKSSMSSAKQVQMKLVSSLPRLQQLVQLLKTSSFCFVFFLTFPSNHFLTQGKWSLTASVLQVKCKTAATAAATGEFATNTTTCCQNCHSHCIFLIWNSSFQYWINEN